MFSNEFDGSFAYVNTVSEGLEEPVLAGGVGDGFQAVEVDFEEGVVLDEGVEVGGVGEALGVGGEPAADIGAVVAAAIVDEAGLFVEAFGAEMPGVLEGGMWDEVVLGVEDKLFAKGAVAVGFGRREGGKREEGGEAALQVMEWGVGLSVQFDGDGGADFGLGSGAEDA